MSLVIKCEDQASFIWKLLVVYFSQQDTPKVIEIVSSMYEQNFTISNKMEDFLTSFWDKPCLSTACDISKEVLKQGDLSIEQHFYIVSMLLCNQCIDVNNAIILLELCHIEEYAKLDVKIQRTIDVLWLVKEDSKDNIMPPDADYLLEKALYDLGNSYNKKLMDVARRNK